MNTSAFFETVEALFHDWHYDSPRILYALVRALKPQAVVETGAYRGYASAYMARALQENETGHLYAIDNFSLTDHTVRYGDARNHLLDNLKKCGVAGFVTLIEGDSDKVQWPDKVDFAYIDGWHSYQAARFDFEQCQQRGARCICFDDTLSCVGPRLSVSDLPGYSQLTLPHDNGLTIAFRHENKRDVTFSQELTNHPGVDLRVLTPEQRRAHFEEASQTTHLNYDEFL